MKGGTVSKATLEKFALAISSLVLVTAVWFWSQQIGNVLETLKLAYG
jgi:hypothetical protein